MLIVGFILDSCSSYASIYTEQIDEHSSARQSSFLPAHASNRSDDLWRQPISHVIARVIFIGQNDNVRRAIPHLVSNRVSQVTSGSPMCSPEVTFPDRARANCTSGNAPSWRRSLAMIVCRGKEQLQSTECESKRFI